MTIAPLEPHLARCGEVGLFILSRNPDQDEPSIVLHHTMYAAQSEIELPQDIWVLHRVLKNDRNAQCMYTRGDHLPLSDTPFQYNQWVGVLTSTHLHTLPVTPPPSSKHAYRILRGLFRISSWVHQKNARSLNARLIGLFWVNFYPIYHRLKYLLSPRSPHR